jgi:hypothetical protein
MPPRGAILYLDREGPAASSIHPQPEGVAHRKLGWQRAAQPPLHRGITAVRRLCRCVGGSPHLLRIRRARHAGRAPSLRKTPGAAIIARHASSWRRPPGRRRLQGHTPWMSSVMNALTGRLVGGVAAWWRRRSGPGPTEASPPALDHLHMPPLQFASRSALTRLPRDRSASARQSLALYPVTGVSWSASC